MTDLNRGIFEGALRNLKEYAWDKGAYMNWDYDEDQPRSFCVLGAVAYTLERDPENDGAYYAFCDNMDEIQAMAEWIWEQTRSRFEWALTCPIERGEVVNMLAANTELSTDEIKRISWEMSQAENIIDIYKHRDCEDGENCKAGMTRLDGSPVIHADHIYAIIDYYVDFIAGWNDWDDTTFDEVTDLLVSL